jgi:hypothetical protein
MTAGLLILLIASLAALGLFFFLRSSRSSTGSRSSRPVRPAQPAQPARPGQPLVAEGRDLRPPLARPARPAVVEAVLQVVDPAAFQAASSTVSPLTAAAGVPGAGHWSESLSELDVETANRETCDKRRQAVAAFTHF